MVLYYDESLVPETITLPISINRYIYVGKGRTEYCEDIFSKHIHSSVEILYVQKGTLYVQKDDDPAVVLTSGDIFLCNPYESHRGYYTDLPQENAYLWLNFEAEYLYAFQDSILHTAGQEISTLAGRFDNFYPAAAADTKELCTHLEQIYACYFQKNLSSECAAMGQFYMLLSILFAGHYHIQPGTEQRYDRTFIQKVTQIVAEQYTTSLTTADMCQQLYMTSSRFCQTFRDNFGRSFMTYLCEYRIRRAEEYRGKDMTIAQIAAAVGFSEYCHFSTAFRKYRGESPAVYFGKWKKKE